METDEYFEKEKVLMRNFIEICKAKDYTEESVRIMGTICLSKNAIEKGFSSLEMFSIAMDYVRENENERDAISKLVKLIS